MKRFAIVISLLIFSFVNAQELKVAVGVEKLGVSQNKWITQRDSLNYPRTVLESTEENLITPYVKVFLETSKWGFLFKGGPVKYDYKYSLDPDYFGWSRDNRLMGVYLRFEIQYKIDLREK